LILQKRKNVGPKNVEIVTDHGGYPKSVLLSFTQLPSHIYAYLGNFNQKL